MEWNDTDISAEKIAEEHWFMSAVGETKTFDFSKVYTNNAEMPLVNRSAICKICRVVLISLKIS